MTIKINKGEIAHTIEQKHMQNLLEQKLKTTKAVTFNACLTNGSSNPLCLHTVAVTKPSAKYNPINRTCINESIYTSFFLLEF
jgi:hypothetical protein